MSPPNVHLEIVATTVCLAHLTTVNDMRRRQTRLRPTQAACHYRCIYVHERIRLRRSPQGSSPRTLSGSDPRMLGNFTTGCIDSLTSTDSPLSQPPRMEELRLDNDTTAFGTDTTSFTRIVSRTHGSAITDGDKCHRRWKESFFATTLLMIGKGLCFARPHARLGTDWLLGHPQPFVLPVKGRHGHSEGNVGSRLPLRLAALICGRITRMMITGINGKEVYLPTTRFLAPCVRLSPDRNTTSSA